MDRRRHWEQVYSKKQSGEMSWFQALPRLSLELIARLGVPVTETVLDVGGGDALLVDHLVAQGFRAVQVLDFSSTALARARRRLGAAAASVQWIEADILNANLSAQSLALWHDRAAFHFLTTPADRAAYVAQVCRALRPGGHVIVATFAEDGPARCSGLAVARYSGTEIRSEFGPEFRFLASQREVHITPSGVRQPFTYCCLVHEPCEPSPGA